MIVLSEKGNFRKTDSFLQKMLGFGKLSFLDKYGRMGVDALSAATPIETGETAHSWGYEIVRENDTASIVFTNNHINNGVNIAIILQYGHATGTGGWVEGRDYINPAVQPIFDQILNEALEEVKKS